MSGNGWAFGASLPGSLTVASLGTYVSIGLDTDHPYEYNDEHVKKYPKEKYKGNKGKDDDDGPGQGKGKGGQEITNLHSGMVPGRSSVLEDLLPPGRQF